MILLILLVLLILAVGVHPRWPYAQDWGYYPTSFLWFILAILLLAYLLGYRF
jgi:hypothetical protein